MNIQNVAKIRAFTQTGRWMHSIYHIQTIPKNAHINTYTGWGREKGDFKNSVIIINIIIINKEFVFAKLQIRHLKVQNMPFIS
jgi:hypothetical protein